MAKHPVMFLDAIGANYDGVTYKKLSSCRPLTPI
ncbi:hypothetical protein EHW99_3010 [Erwinia amylovora]|nr:hypothetical protein EHX00_3010 [Erwinia amylovora]QJQ59408.1 hypothetical protein EHW99_3010 [Erwinia amylovora]QJQ63107.1 hypothetical protein EHW98_3010 [Erwinia amylovora]QJQ66909.1 hypothetical protein EHW96_3010 [Erwinia amylovora]QJQ70608.1 hypothetical protein EGZ89_3010 [Erwinia amylovora]